MMRKYFAILGLLALLIPLVLGSVFQARTVSAQDGQNSKISSLLALQVEAKLRTLEAAPLEEGYVDILQAMQAMGMQVEDLNKQRIFIHLSQELNASQIEELESMGIILHLGSWIPPVGVHPTGFIIAEMPVDKLNELAEKNYVIRLNTAERVLEPHNDLATQKINADDVWGLGYDGTGVTIAVLDSGLDVTHNDIPTPTASKDYSDYPTLDDTIANQVTGHGTHVTGSALGRGTQSGGVYKGSAPGASLIFLKIGNDTTSGASTDAIVNAIKDAIDTYNADIITMSYGGWDTYHDGTSEEAQAVDYAVSQGAVVFISAGNDADDDEHYSGTVAASSSTGFIQVNVTGAGTNDTVLWFNLVWYDGLGTNNVLTGQFYDSGYNSLSTINEAQSESTRGTEARWCYYGPSSGYMYYLPSGSGTYYLKVTNSSAASQDFHIYVRYAGVGSVTFQSPDPDYTITSPADADSAIAVGAYTTRKYWWDYQNNHWWYVSGETVDQIATLSSRGPRVDTGAPPKPNVVAPGSAIISARDNDVYPWPAGAGPPFIDNDGPNEDDSVKNDGTGPADYYVMQGTSMACPHAAGVAALILEKDPTWTPAQVKHALESTATDKGDVGWDKVYGWGLVDALAALLTADPVPPTMESIVEPQGQSYNTAPSFSNFGFDDDEALDDGWYQMDSFTGIWTVLFTDAAGTSWDDDGWTIPGFAGVSEGSHTIYFKASDDAGNVEGESGEWSWQFFKDTTPPAAVTDLGTTAINDTTIRLTWTAPGDDGAVGTATSYDIRYSTSDLSVPANWTAATQCVGEPAPSIAGSSETLNVTGLTTGTLYYFALKTADEVPNQSTLSNVPSGTTLSPLIPTISQWGMIGMATVFCALLVWAIRRRSVTAGRTVER